jgi:hypothetical protein
LGWHAQLAHRPAAWPLASNVVRTLGCDPVPLNAVIHYKVMVQIHNQGVHRMNFLRYGMLALGLLVTLPAVAQTQSTSTDMQILADKINADKKALVAQNMELTETEAKSFWPIYDAYQQDLQTINIRMTQMIVEYADASSKGTLDNAAAKKLLGEALMIQKSELDLQQTYVPKLEKVLPEVKVARYIQIESKIRALVRYALASKIPLAE